MAGIKGKSGGARVNSGGARTGAGRKAKPKIEVIEIAECDMLKLLQDVALGRVDASTIQVRAAIAAVQYTHVKKADGGKKDDKQGAAEKASTGRFGASAPPRLISSRG